MGGVSSRHSEGGLDQANWTATAQALMEQTGLQQRVELRLAAHGLPKKDKLRWVACSWRSWPAARLYAAASKPRNLASFCTAR